MAISTEDLAQIDALLEAAEVAAGAVSELRARFPKLSLTRCSPSEMGVEEAFRRYRKFDLYLVNGQNHCWQITSDPKLATGLVLVSR